MARKALVEKQKKRKEMVNRHWQQRQELKKKAIDLTLNEEERFKARLALNKMKKDTCPIRLRNRCSLTGRSRGFLRKFKVSRLVFREMANIGLIPGVTKASW